MITRTHSFGLLVLTLMSIGQAVGQIHLIEDGKTDYRIMIDADASSTEVFAVEELQGYMAQLSGVFLPMDQGDVPTVGKHILVGNGAIAKLGLEVDEDFLGQDGFVIKTLDDRIILAGGSPRGTLYCIYAFLEMLGCRWLAPGILGEVISRIPVVVIPPMAHSERPSIAYRGFTNRISAPHEWAQWIDWMGKNRMNYLMIHLSDYADFKAVVGGELEKRQIDTGVSFDSIASGDGQMPVDQILEFISSNPEADIIELPANESSTRIAGIIRERYPGKIISIRAHDTAASDIGYSILDAPYPASSIERPALRRCYRHSLADEDCEINREIKSYLEGQLKASGKVYIHEHYMGSYEQNSLPFPILHTISSDLRYFDELDGVEGVISQCEPGNWGTYGLNYYIFARMAWNTDNNLGSIVDDYCEKYYGSAGVPMGKYFARLEDAMAAMEHFRYVEPPHLILELLDEELLAELGTDIRNASGMADGAMVFDRIRKVQLSLDHAKLLRHMLHYYSSAIQYQKIGEFEEARVSFDKSIETGEKLVAFLFQNIDEGVFIIPESYIFEYLEPLITDARDRKDLLDARNRGR